MKKFPILIGVFLALNSAVQASEIREAKDNNKVREWADRQVNVMKYLSPEKISELNDEIEINRQAMKKITGVDIFSGGKLDGSKLTKQQLKDLKKETERHQREVVRITGVEMDALKKAAKKQK